MQFLDFCGQWFIKHFQMTHYRQNYKTLTLTK